MPWLDDVTVTKAGPAENGVIYVALKPADDSWHRWFQAHSSFEREILASALTAVSGSKKAQVRLTSTNSYGTIERFYVKA
ncbi:MAG: hypothetical protein ACR2QK_18705 [Acidimicrobiales bacterium]